MTYGQEFHAFASFLKKRPPGTRTRRPATDHTEPRRHRHRHRHLRRPAVPHDRYTPSGRHHRAAHHRGGGSVAAMTDMSGYIATSQTVKNLAIHLKKAADDLRLLNSGPHTGFDDLNVPARQAGSSIMPGKVNPVIPECVNQCCFMVFGMDTTVTWAASEGQLQLNAFDPVIIHELLNGIELLTRAMAMFRERCVSGITINASTGRRYAEYSPVDRRRTERRHRIRTRGRHRPGSGQRQSHRARCRRRAHRPARVDARRAARPDRPVATSRPDLPGASVDGYRLGRRRPDTSRRRPGSAQPAESRIRCRSWSGRNRRRCRR